MLFVKFKFLSKIKLYLFISLSATTNYFLKQYSGHLSDLDLHIIWTQETLLYLYLIFVLYHNGNAGFMKYILCTVHECRRRHECRQNNSLKCAAFILALI